MLMLLSLFQGSLDGNVDLLILLLVGEIDRKMTRYIGG